MRARADGSFSRRRNFNNIVRGLLRREPTLDILRAQDVDLSQAPDPEVLEWAATESRVLLTHDVTTVRKYAGERIADGLMMSGVVFAGRRIAVSTAIDDIPIIDACSEQNEWAGILLFLPL